MTLTITLITYEGFISGKSTTFLYQPYVINSLMVDYYSYYLYRVYY